jgi:hypothetical protein
MNQYQEAIAFLYSKSPEIQPAEEYECAAEESLD